MRYIFVNLKRFEVSRKLGGLCPMDDPQEWIISVIQKCHDMGLGAISGLTLTFLLPEGLLASANIALTKFKKENSLGMRIGCQGLHWEDIEPGKNFGAFTSNLPAKAAIALKSEWAIIGHSEERRAKLNLIKEYDDQIDDIDASALRAASAVNRIIGLETVCGLQAGLKILLCVGETALERGEGELNEIKTRIETVLQNQLTGGIAKAAELGLLQNIVIGYEPVWAIGPGKVPPDREYISLVTEIIKQLLINEFGCEMPVVYGGGLKEENAAMIRSIPGIDGGLVALTRFKREIGFYPEELKDIIVQYLSLEK